jgi:uncharacterized protein YqgV (UPF0045/DUF77 family)
MMARLSAQISVYPLRQTSLSPTIDEAVGILRRHGLEVYPGVMSTRVVGDEDSVFAAMREAFGRSAERGDVVMVVTISQACPVSGEGEVSP